MTLLPLGEYFIFQAVKIAPFSQRWSWSHSPGPNLTSLLSWQVGLIYFGSRAESPVFQGKEWSEVYGDASPVQPLGGWCVTWLSVRGDVLRHFASQRVKRKTVSNLVDESELRLKEIGDRACKDRCWVISDTAVLTWLMPRMWWIWRSQSLGNPSLGQSQLRWISRTGLILFWNSMVGLWKDLAFCPYSLHRTSQIN